jgi:hypothetical protein
MERQPRGRQPKVLADLARRKPGFAPGHEQADKLQPLVIGKRCQGRQDFTSLHASITQESLNNR